MPDLVVCQGAPREADQAVAMDRARVPQAFRLTDGHLGRQAVSARGDGRADHCAELRRIAEGLPADDDEYPRAFRIGPGEVGDPAQAPAPHGRTWYSSTSAISAFSLAACFQSSAASRAWSAT